MANGYCITILFVIKTRQASIHPQPSNGNKISKSLITILEMYSISKVMPSLNADIHLNSKRML